MASYTLRVGYITFGDPLVDDYYLEIISRLAASYGGKAKGKVKNNAFVIPCSVDCQDFSCTKNINCNLMEYKFDSEEVETPNDLLRCHGALAMLDPVCAVKTVNPNDPTDVYFWNRFDEDDEQFLDKQTVLN